MPSSYHETSVPSQVGKTVFVTGANTGLGYEATRVLAGRGARVLLGCRSEQKASAAIAAIHELHPRADLAWIPLDLTSLASIEEAAARVAEEPRLDILINNAGVMIPPLGHTQDGFELQFGINHLGHFALTGHLMQRLATTADSRVVTVTSLAHREGQIEFEDPNALASYEAMPRYRMSKLANMVFTLELARRCAARRLDITSVAAHPGIADTELSRTFPAWFRLVTPIVRTLFNTPPEGALPILLAATGDEVEAMDYYGPTKRRETARSAGPAEVLEWIRDENLGKELWDTSVAMTGVSYLVD